MLAENLRKIRQARNLSIAKFAEEIGGSSNTLSSYERNLRLPSMDFGVLLYEKLKVNLNWLVSGKGNMFIDNCENTHIIIHNTKPLENFKTWGKRLGQVLADNNELPYDFSKKTGISEARIEKMILDSVEPTISELNAIKANVDISIDELLYGQTVEKTQTNDSVSLSIDEILKLKKLINDSKA